MTVGHRREPAAASRPVRSDGVGPEGAGPEGAGPEEDRPRDAGSDLTWGVGAVAGRLGITASTLRTWERRYGVGPSYRTQGGHRRYTERDIDRVELMRRLVGRGVSAQDAARVARSLDRDELDLALTDEVNRVPPRIDPDDLVDAVVAAVVTGDMERVSQLFVGLLRQGKVTDAWRAVLAPSLVRISLESTAGSLSRESAQAASNLLMRELRALIALERLPDVGRASVLFARNVPEIESIPLLVIEAAVIQAGISTTAVGPDIGSRSVASMATRLRPDLVVTWGYSPDAHLRRAAETLADMTSLVLAGPAWPHQLSLRFGLDAPAVPTDATDAVNQFLDRVT